MKFSEFIYERPNIDDLVIKIQEITKKLEQSSNANDALHAIKEINDISDYYQTQSALCRIRNSCNSLDEFYDKEIDFFSENNPKISSAFDKWNKVLVKTPFKQDIQDKFGKYYFEKLELSLKCFDDSIMDDLVIESKLENEYDKLIASCEVSFEGEVCNLSKLSKYTKNQNRDIRKRAVEATANFFAQNEENFDRIYDELVKIRTSMAKKLGYENYVDFGYARLGRTDYNSEMVKQYREQVYKHIVPIHQEIIKKQAKRINIEHLMCYDLDFKFIDGNATPKGTKDDLVNAAKKMYGELSKETEEFFQFMIDQELLDLETRKGKHGGGYCSYIPNYKSPFIFSNFNGTSADVDVLTHEAGHAFQVYTTSKHIDIPDFLWPTYEACEIHSMSMEFFAYPYLEYFMKEDTLKYKYSHLSDSLSFIPYGVAVDEFQHYVYEFPQATPKIRKDKWREIEKKYLPHKNYDGFEILKRGGFFYRQGHIFTSPFYYIDYTLAQICALAFYLENEENHDKAWNKYYQLCKLGGSKSFLGLLDVTGMDNPFIDGTIEKIMKKIMPNLEKIKF